MYVIDRVEIRVRSRRVAALISIRGGPFRLVLPSATGSEVARQSGAPIASLCSQYSRSTRSLLGAHT